eukprot:TRINITY_DN5275_c0_g3_i2.p1 TRINITY_DN5275_c0_g3~~TRINITY_DN5275_c0_g3_i2.p1  ORF type:complete len:296 (-),score=63.62 TRINITY_DN5275_c0_g3_i2:109-996(-)
MRCACSAFVPWSQKTLKKRILSTNNRPGKRSEFSFSFNAFNENTFGRFKDTSLLKWITSNIQGESREELKEAIRCLEKMEEKEIIEPELYKAAMVDAARFREEQKDYELFTLSYLIESSIANSLCGRLFDGALNESMEKEEIKEYKDVLKAIKDEIQFNTDFSNKFMEQINALYERHSHPSNPRETPTSLYSIEFAAYFFKSLSTLFADELNAHGKLGLEGSNERAPLLEGCVELRRVFVMSCVMMVAVRYLQVQIKNHCNDSTDCSIAPSRYEDLHAVRPLVQHRQIPTAAKNC